MGVSDMYPTLLASLQKQIQSPPPGDGTSKASIPTSSLLVPSHGSLQLTMGFLLNPVQLTWTSCSGGVTSMTKRA